MLSRNFKRLTTSVRRMQENPGLSEGNPGRNKRTWGCLCESEKRLGFGFVKSGGGFGISKGTKFWVKKPYLPKNRPHVPVHVSGVPVHFGHCLFLRRVYRYTWRVYRYTLATVPFCVRCTGTLWRCTGTPVPFFFFLLFSFFNIIFSNWEQWCRCEICLCQLPSILGSTACSPSFCSYSTQLTVSMKFNRTSFFRHFQSFHGSLYC